ncbi:MAG: histone deacetylase family protein [Alphaproteobacteria bacterium]
MTTRLYSHDAGLAHEGPPGHPERPDRLRAVLEALAAPEFDALERAEAPLADNAAIAAVHGRDHIAKVRATEPSQGLGQLDPDTYMSPGSLEAALRAAGAGIAAVDAVLGGQIDNAFCAMRPPGHHAERDKAMGFCLFNNAAIAARHAQSTHGLDRVAIVDFDVHHGNGTQEIFWDDSSVFYASTHQMPLYPGSGAKSETGAGNIVNVPLEQGAGAREFRAAMTDIIFPALNDFAPQLLIISAGFDAHERDPLGGLNLTDDDFAWVTGHLKNLAKTHCQGAVVSLLEGGYDLVGLARASAAHVKVLMDE